MHGKLRDVHDVKAHSVLLQIASDFKPTHIINGGDGLDCGAISHHRLAEGARSVEGFRLSRDADLYRKEVLAPLEKLKSARIYIEGNHEAWLEQFLDQVPGLEGAVSLDSLLKLSQNGWTLKPQGSVVTIGGKLHFLHGDTVRGGDNCAKSAVISYGRSVLFGHYHTSQRYTKHNALDATDIHRGFAVGCLCRRDPRFIKSAPNRWSQSIALIEEETKTGQFQVNEIEISEGKAIYNGKIYRG